MSRVDRTERARVDLLQIWNYIAERNFPAANRTLDELLGVLNLMSTQPGMGEAVDQMRSGARRFCVGSYVLYYEPIDDGIRLLRVVHSARQVDDLFESLE